MTKHQGHRANKLKNHYARQFAITTANKNRRAAKRNRKKIGIVPPKVLRRAAKRAHLQKKSN